jgi:hypothetical protein
VQNDGSAVRTLWAREKIEDLQAQDWMGAQTGHPKPDIQAQIVATALEYRLMSQYTSFVAVEEKVVNIGGRMRMVDVPVEMPEGVSYEGIFGEKETEELAKLGKPVTLMSRMAAGRGAAGGFGGAPGGAAHFYANTAAQVPPLQQKSANAAAGMLPSGIQPGDLYGYDADNSIIVRYKDVALGKAESLKRLDAMKPEERRALLAQVKMAPALRDLAAKVKKEGVNGSLSKPGLPTVTNGRVDVQIWLNSLPPDSLTTLKALGFTLTATLQPNRLLLGSLPVEKLDALVALSFVRRVEPPRFR